MRRKFYIAAINCALCAFNSAYSQNPLVKMWDLSLGGTNNDVLTCLINTNDGGCMVGGSSASGISGNKTEACWGYGDYWIVKLDAAGNKQWDKTFGGSLTDELHSVIQTSDKGYMLAGFSNSGISGNKTEALKGNSDYWIVKTDSLGNMLWDKDYGGTSANILRAVEETPDGGYILGGYSDSPVGADKTQPSNGQFDFWVIKIDSSGNKLWDKTYGGSGYEGSYAATLKVTYDGGFIVGGFSNSGISGDKTEVCFGNYDYWIIKADSSGNKQWDKVFGGTEIEYLNSIEQTNDGGFLLGGPSGSPVSGNKTSQLWAGFGDIDLWVIKTDSLGNAEWQKDYGGTLGEDEFGNIFLTNDGGYLFTGNSYSAISGDKSENNLGNEQTWSIKTDSLGNREWDKTMLTATTFDDETGLGIQMKDGCYAFANFTNAGIGGYKSQPSWGPYDYWIVKFCDSTLMSPNASFLADQNLCPGTCTNFINQSSNALSYQWFFPGANPNFSSNINPVNICYSTPGDYNVMLIASNTNGSDTIALSNYISVYPQPSPQSISQNGDTLFALAGAAFYQWYINATLIPGSTNYFYIAQSSGDYNVIATDTNGCEVEAVINNVVANTTPLSIGEKSWVRLFPNPVENELIIENGKWKMGTTAEISIYNILGEKIELAVDCCPLTVDCRQLESGMYYIEIKTGNKIFRSKFLKH